VNFLRLFITKSLSSAIAEFIAYAWGRADGVMVTIRWQDYQIGTPKKHSSIIYEWGWVE